MEAALGSGENPSPQGAYLTNGVVVKLPSNGEPRWAGPWFDWIGMSTFGMLPQRYSFSFLTPLSLKYGGQILKKMDLKEHPVICLFGKWRFQLACGAHKPSSRLTKTKVSLAICPREQRVVASSVIPGHTQPWLLPRRALVLAPFLGWSDGWRGHHAHHSGPAGGWLPCFFCCVPFGPSKIRMWASFGRLPF